MKNAMKKTREHKEEKEGCLGNPFFQYKMNQEVQFWVQEKPKNVVMGSF